MTEPARNLTDAQITDLADYLRGTCADLSVAVALCFEGRTEDDLAPGDCQELDAQVLVCERCGWWEEATEFDEDGICNDCQQENEE